MGPFYLKKQKWRRFPVFPENILFELGAVHYSRLPILIFTQEKVGSILVPWGVFDS
jgi:hypothetical protein